MGLMRLKFKAHRLVNIIFYGVFFIVGFFLGHTTQKLDFSTIFSKILYVDSVSAADVSYGIDSTTFTRPTSSNFYKASYIYYTILNEINDLTGWDINLDDLPYVFVSSISSGVYSTSNNYYYVFSDADFTGWATAEVYTTATRYCSLRLDYYYGSYTLGCSYDLTGQHQVQNGTMNRVTATNGTLGNISHRLDFSTILNPSFDSSYMDNNSNWTKYCADSQNSLFSVYPLNVPNSSNNLTGYIVNIGQFKHYITADISLPNTSNGFVDRAYMEHSHEQYFLNSRSNMDLYLQDTIISNFNSRYPDMYDNLYGWSILPFSYQYQNTQGDNINTEGTKSGVYRTSDGSFNANNTNYTSVGDLLSIGDNTKFIFSNSNNASGQWLILEYDNNKNYLGYQSTSVNDSTAIFSLQYSNTRYIIAEIYQPISNVGSIYVRPLQFQLTLPVFRFKDTYRLNAGCITSSVGGVTQCVAPNNPNSWTDNQISNTGELCFYVNNDYGVKFWQTDDFNDIDDTFTYNGVTYTINTNTFKNIDLESINSNNYSSFTGYFSTLLQRLSTPILFITSNISYLFNGLPEPIRYFLISFVVMGLIVGIIKMLTGGK